MRRLICTLMALAAAACGAEPPGEGTQLLYASPYSPNHPFSRADRRWMDFVETRSEGSLTIRANWSGGVLSSEHSMIELRRGVADVGLITPIYIKGGTHLIRTQSGFYSGISTIEEQVRLYRCLEDSLPRIAEETAGLKILAVQGGSLPWVITRSRPVETLGDLRGLRLRAPVELLPVLRDLGADPVNMSMSEVYSALAKGVLDGVVAPPDTFNSLHFAEVTGNAAALAIPRGAYPARAMNRERWNSLTDAQRAVLDESVAVWEAALAEEIRAELDVGVQTARDRGVRITEISEQEQAEFDRLYLRDARANAGRLERFGIDGPRAFELARASIGGDGTVSCRNTEDG